MDRVPNDPIAAFLPMGGYASPIVGLYAPHVVGRLVDLSPDQLHLSAQSIADVKSGVRPLFVVYGPPSLVERIVATFPQDLGLGTKLLDETHGSALRYRLVAFAMPDRSVLPFTWRADALPLGRSHLEGTAAVVGPGDPSGFVTFGPYVSLPSGRYTATVNYSSSEPPGRSVGVFDVSASRLDGTATTASTSSAIMMGTNGVDTQLSITFDATDPKARYEFRTRWEGAGSMTVRSITYDRG
jgi:hypothetical protein